MKLHTLPKTNHQDKKRLGRGYGSGQGGHTSSRGQKGQKARSKVALWFEGGQLPLAKRIPFLRGKDRFKSLENQVVVLNLNDLEKFEDGAEVTKETLVSHKLVSLKEAANARVKILGSGTIDKKLVLRGLSISQSAAKKITAAGGTIE